MATTAKIAVSGVPDFHFISLGGVEPKRTRLFLATRKNVDGVAYQLHGTGGQPHAVRGVADVVAADVAALKAIIEAYVALQGKQVTVTDEHGIELTDVFVQNVRIPLDRGPNPQRIRTPVGGRNGSSATHLITVEFVLVDTSVL